MDEAMTIQKIRLGARLSQRDFAISLGTTPAAVSAWERGVNTPTKCTMYLLQRVADADPLIDPKGWLPPYAGYQALKLEDPAQFARLIREARESLGMSQYDMADAYCVPYQTYLAWETGRRKPTATTAYLLMHCIDLDFPELITERLKFANAIPKRRRYAYARDRLAEKCQKWRDMPQDQFDELYAKR